MTETWQQMIKRHRHERVERMKDAFHQSGGHPKAAALIMGVPVGTLRKWIRIEFGGVETLRGSMKL